MGIKILSFFNTVSFVSRFTHLIFAELFIFCSLVRLKNGEILDAVERFVFENSLIDVGGNVIAAVSGGSDSVFMLCFLREFARKYGITFRALHINHQLRGRESDIEETFVQSLCEEWKIPLLIYRIGLAKQIGESGAGIEELARNRRRTIYAEVANKYGAKVALAHTADDVVETFLFNLFRGSGIRGLAEMEPKSDFIIRPILKVWRHQARRFLMQNKIPWREDTSNRDLRFSRNKIRHRIIPDIVANFGPKSVEHIRDAAAMLRMTRRTLERFLHQHFEESLVGRFDGIVVFYADRVLEDPFTFGEMLRRALEMLGIGLKGFSNERVDNLFRRLLDARPDQKFMVYGGAFAIRIGKFLIIGHSEPMLVHRASIEPGETIVLDNDLGEIEAELVPPPADFSQKPPNEAYISYSGEKILIAPYSEGIYFRPLGGVSMKLSSFLKKRGIPAIFRRGIPLVFVGRQLAWVAGTEISEQFKITGGEKTVLKLTWRGEFPRLLSAITKSGRRAG